MKNLFKYFLLLWMLISFGLMEFCYAQESPKEFVYAGTWDMRGSEGLYVFEFDRKEGTLSHIQTVSDKTAPEYQAIHPLGNYLYSVSSESINEDEDVGSVTAYSIDPETGILTMVNEQTVGDTEPVHISIDPMGKFVYTSQYGGGSLSVIELHEDGSLGELLDLVKHEGSSINRWRQNKPYVHSIFPSADGRFIYVPDLGIDKVMIYEVDRGTGKLTTAEIPYIEITPGAGPRHFSLHPDGGFAYLVEEIDYSVSAYSVDKSNGALEPIQRLNLIPDDVEAGGNISGADIHTSADGRYLYISVRGYNHLVVYEINSSSGLLSLVERVSTGSTPRNFHIDTRGEFLFTGNQDDDTVTVFRRNQDTGELTSTGTEVNVPAVVSVIHFIPDAS